MKAPTTIKEFYNELAGIKTYLKYTREQKEFCRNQIQQFTEKYADSIKQQDKLQAVKHKITIEEWEFILLEICKGYSEVITQSVLKVVEFRKEWEQRMRQ